MTQTPPENDAAAVKTESEDSLPASQGGWMCTSLILAISFHIFPNAEEPSQSQPSVLGGDTEIEDTTTDDDDTQPRAAPKQRKIVCVLRI